MRRSAFLLASAAAATAVLAVAPAADAQRTVTCESNNGRQHLCRVDTSGGVRLARQLSDAPCRQGRSWWATGAGITVARGCRAQFYVGRDGRNDRDRWDDRDGGRRGREEASFSNARNRCERAVASRLGISSRSVSARVQDQSRNSVRLSWRADRRASGTCRIDRDGDVRVTFDRDGRRGR